MKINQLKIYALLALLLAFLLAACQTGTAPTAVEKTPSAVKDSAVLVSRAETDSAEPGIAVAPDGSVFVVWTEHVSGKQADVYFQKFTRDRLTDSAPVRVNPNPGEATAWRGDPPTVKAGADGKIYVGWTASVEKDGKKGTDLFLSVSRDGGKTFVAPVKINDDSAPASHGMHSLAVDANNRVFMAWLDERNVKPMEKAAIEEPLRAPTPEFQIVKIHEGANHQKQTPTPDASKVEETEPNSEIFYAVSTDGGARFSANKKLASDICPCCKTSAVLAPGGEIYVSWRQVFPNDFRHIVVASSRDGGASFSAPVLVSDDQWQLNACPVSGAAMTAVDDKRLEIVWFTAGKAGQPGLYRSESSDGGKTFAPRRAIYESDAVGATNLISDDQRNLRIVFESFGKLFSQTGGETKEIGSGETPVAVVSGGKTFVAFVKKETGRRGIWLNVLEN